MEDLIKGELDWHNKVNENFHEVDSQMAEKAKQADLDTTNKKVGDISQLNTDDKSNIVNAIKEVKSQADLDTTNKKVGDISQLNTDDKSNIVNAIKEVKSQANTKANKSQADNIQTQVNNLVLGAVGDGNNAEVIQARGKYPVLNDRINYIDFNSDKNEEYIPVEASFENKTFNINTLMFEESPNRISCIFENKINTIIECTNGYKAIVIYVSKNINDNIYSTPNQCNEWSDIIELKANGQMAILIIKKEDDTNILPSDSSNVTVQTLQLNWSKHDIISHLNYANLNGYSDFINYLNGFAQGVIDIPKHIYINNSTRLRALISIDNLDKIIAIGDYEFALLNESLTYKFTDEGMYYNDSSGSSAWISKCNIYNLKRNKPEIENLYIIVRKKDDSDITAIDAKNIIFMRNKIIKTMQRNNFVVVKQIDDTENNRIKVAINKYNNIDMKNKIINVTLKTNAPIDTGDLVFFNSLSNNVITNSFIIQKSITEDGKNIYNATMCADENLSHIVINDNGKNLTGNYELNIELNNVTLDFTVIPLENYTIPNNIVANNWDVDKFRTELGNIKYNIGMSLLKQRIYSCVDNYIATNGYIIDGIVKTTQEIFEWFIDKDNYKTHGKLYKDGQFLKDSNGNIVELRGVCLMHIPTLVGKLHTFKVLKTLKYYGINLVRLPAYSEYIVSSGIDKYDKSCYGYRNNKEEIKSAMDIIINWCKELGLYVVVDYHYLDRWGDLSKYKPDAVDFFTYFSNKYKDYDNVLFEIVNEPFNANIDILVDFIETIRNIIVANVENPILISGVTNSSEQGVADLNTALQNKGITDVFLSLHNYTGDGFDETVYNNLYTNNIALFITEWGNSKWSGTDNGKDMVAQRMLDLFHTNKIPHIVFQLSAIEANCSLLNYNAEINYFYKFGGFNYEDLSSNGKLFFDAFFNYAFKNI